MGNSCSAGEEGVCVCQAPMMIKCLAAVQNQNRAVQKNFQVVIPGEERRDDRNRSNIVGLNSIAHRGTAMKIKSSQLRGSLWHSRVLQCSSEPSPSVVHGNSIKFNSKCHAQKLEKVLRTLVLQFLQHSACALRKCWSSISFIWHSADKILLANNLDS